MPEEAYGKAKVKKTQIYERYERFRDGRASVKDDPHFGQSPASTNDENMGRVPNVMRRRESIQEISAEVGISVGNIHDILHKDFSVNVGIIPLNKTRLSSEYLCSQYRHMLCDLCDTVFS
jgi:hypothetical protein